MQDTSFVGSKAYTVVDKATMVAEFTVNQVQTFLTVLLAWLQLHGWSLFQGTAVVTIVTILLETFIYSRKEKGEWNTVPLPSTLVAQIAKFLQNLFEKIGFWMGRLLNPFYWINKLKPWIQPVWNSTERLTKATGSLDYPPLYHFFVGLFDTKDKPFRYLPLTSYGDLMVLFVGLSYILFSHRRGYSAAWRVGLPLVAGLYMLVVKAWIFLRKKADKDKEDEDQKSTLLHELSTPVKTEVNRPIPGAPLKRSVRRISSNSRVRSKRKLNFDNLSGEDDACDYSDLESDTE